MTRPVVGRDKDGAIVRQCSATARRTGKRCERNAMKGQDVCYTHGGAARHNRRAGERRVEKERVDNELAVLLDELEADLGEVDPLQVLAEQMRHATAMATVLRLMVGDLNGTGLIVDGAFGSFPHPALKLYREWSDQAARLAKLGIDAGLERRRVELAEREADLMADALRLVADGLLAIVATVAPDAVSIARAGLPDLYTKAIELIAPEDT